MSLEEDGKIVERILEVKLGLAYTDKCLMVFDKAITEGLSDHLVQEIVSRLNAAMRIEAEAIREEALQRIRDRINE